MKAAVIKKFGDTPQYEDFPDPMMDKDDILIHVKAVALENFDKVTAKGTHYSSNQIFRKFPAIVGHGGVGTLEDGSTLVAFVGTEPPYGTMAEKAVVPKKNSMQIFTIPEGVDASIAAALWTSAMTAILALKYGAKLKPAETVLINGATGFSGKVAVQVAKLLGAGRVIGTGRDEEGLRSLMELGAEAAIDLKQTDEKIIEAFIREAKTGYDVVLDFLWGHPTELLFKTLVPKEVGFVTHRTRFIEIGEAAGPTIQLSAETLRTSGLEITGAVPFPPEAMPGGLKQVWEWIKDGVLRAEIEKVQLKDIAEAWQRKIEAKRIIIIP